jgi:2-haloacid dehalogenase
MNIIFDFGNVLVRWEPERVFLPYFDGNEAKYWFFWRHVCDATFRNRIDAGEDSHLVISQQKERYPEFSEAIEMYMSRWEDSLPGEMPGMYQLLQELKANPTYSIYGLTNWSMETFPQARAKFPVLQLIDRYVVSGDIGDVKPHPRIFHTLLDRYELAPDDCTFIDDNPDNVEGAKKLGIHGILFQGAEPLRKELGLI